MAWLSTSATQTSCTMYVGGLMSFSTYTEIYISCNGQNSPNLIYGGSGYTTSKSWTIYRLSAGTDYFASYRIRTQAGNSDSSGQWFTTEYPPAPPSVGGVGYVSLSNSGEGSISVSWSWASNAEQYRVEVYNYYSGSYITGTQTTSTSTYIYGLPTGTYLEVKVYGMRSGSSNGTPSYNYITTTDYSVGGVGNVYVSAPALSGVLDVSWSYANNATGYRLEVYNYYTGAYIAGYQISGTSYRVTGLSENTYYQVKVYGQRNGNNGTPSYGYGWTYSFAPAQLTNLTAQAGTDRKSVV